MKRAKSSPFASAHVPSRSHSPSRSPSRSLCPFQQVHLSPCPTTIQQTPSETSQPTVPYQEICKILADITDAGPLIQCKSCILQSIDAHHKAGADETRETPSDKTNHKYMYIVRQCGHQVCYACAALNRCQLCDIPAMFPLDYVKCLDASRSKQDDLQQHVSTLSAKYRRKHGSIVSQHANSTHSASLSYKGTRNANNTPLPPTLPGKAILIATTEPNETDKLSGVNRVPPHLKQGRKSILLQAQQPFEARSKSLESRHDETDVGTVPTQLNINPGLRLPASHFATSSQTYAMTASAKTPVLGASGRRESFSSHSAGRNEPIGTTKHQQLLGKCDVHNLHPTQFAPPPEDAKCLFCGLDGNLSAREVLGALLGPGQCDLESGYVHLLCAVWAPLTYSEENEAFLHNVDSEVNRAKSLICYVCKKKGAAMGCQVKSCNLTFHYKCARDIECRRGKLPGEIYCHRHSSRNRRFFPFLPDAYGYVKKDPMNQNDDECYICKEAGDLLLCDICTNAVHTSCCAELLAGDPVEDLPWYCNDCMQKYPDNELRDSLRQNRLELISAAMQEQLNRNDGNPQDVLSGQLSDDNGDQDDRERFHSVSSSVRSSSSSSSSSCALRRVKLNHHTQLDPEIEKLVSPYKGRMKVRLPGFLRLCWRSFQKSCLNVFQSLNSKKHAPLPGSGLVSVSDGCKYDPKSFALQACRFSNTKFLYCFVGTRHCPSTECPCRSIPPVGYFLSRRKTGFVNENHSLERRDAFLEPWEWRSLAARYRKCASFVRINTMKPSSPCSPVSPLLPDDEQAPCFDRPEQVASGQSGVRLRTPSSRYPSHRESDDTPEDVPDQAKSFFSQGSPSRAGSKRSKRPHSASPLGKLDNQLSQCLEEQTSQAPNYEKLSVDSCVAKVIRTSGLQNSARDKLEDQGWHLIKKSRMNSKTIGHLNREPQEIRSLPIKRNSTAGNFESSHKKRRVTKLSSMMVASPGSVPKPMVSLKVIPSHRSPGRETSYGILTYAFRESCPRTDSKHPYESATKKRERAKPNVCRQLEMMGGTSEPMRLQAGRPTALVDADREQSPRSIGAKQSCMSHMKSENETSSYSKAPQKTQFMGTDDDGTAFRIPSTIAKARRRVVADKLKLKPPNMNTVTGKLDSIVKRLVDAANNDPNNMRQDRAMHRPANPQTASLSDAEPQPESLNRISVFATEKSMQAIATEAEQEGYPQVKSNKRKSSKPYHYQIREKENEAASCDANFASMLKSIGRKSSANQEASGQLERLPSWNAKLQNRFVDSEDSDEGQCFDVVDPVVLKERSILLKAKLLGKPLGPIWTQPRLGISRSFLDHWSAGSRTAKWLAESTPQRLDMDESICVTQMSKTLTSIKDILELFGIPPQHREVDSATRLLDLEFTLRPYLAGESQASWRRCYSVLCVLVFNTQLDGIESLTACLIDHLVSRTIGDQTNMFFAELTNSMDARYNPLIASWRLLLQVVENLRSVDDPWAFFWNVVGFMIAKQLATADESCKTSSTPDLYSLMHSTSNSWEDRTGNPTRYIQKILTREEIEKFLHAHLWNQLDGRKSMWAFFIRLIEVSRLVILWRPGLGRVFTETNAVEPWTLRIPPFWKIAETLVQSQLNDPDINFLEHNITCSIRNCIILVRLWPLEESLVELVVDYLNGKSRILAVVKHCNHLATNIASLARAEETATGVSSAGAPWKMNLCELVFQLVKELCSSGAATKKFLSRCIRSEIRRFEDQKDHGGSSIRHSLCMFLCLSDCLENENAFVNYVISLVSNVSNQDGRWRLYLLCIVEALLYRCISLIRKGDDDLWLPLGKAVSLLSTLVDRIQVEPLTVAKSLRQPSDFIPVPLAIDTAYKHSLPGPSGPRMSNTAGFSNANDGLAIVRNLERIYCLITEISSGLKQRSTGDYVKFLRVDGLSSLFSFWCSQSIMKHAISWITNALPLCTFSASIPGSCPSMNLGSHESDDFFDRIDPDTEFHRAELIDILWSQFRNPVFQLVGASITICESSNSAAGGKDCDLVNGPLACAYEKVAYDALRCFAGMQLMFMEQNKASAIELLRTGLVFPAPELVSTASSRSHNHPASLWTNDTLFLEQHTTCFRTELASVYWSLILSGISNRPHPSYSNLLVITAFSAVVKKLLYRIRGPCLANGIASDGSQPPLVSVKGANLWKTGIVNDTFISDVIPYAEHDREVYSAMLSLHPDSALEDSYKSTQWSPRFLQKLDFGCQLVSSLSQTLLGHFGSPGDFDRETRVSAAGLLMDAFKSCIVWSDQCIREILKSPHYERHTRVSQVLSLVAAILQAVRPDVSGTKFVNLLTTTDHLMQSLPRYSASLLKVGRTLEPSPEIVESIFVCRILASPRLTDALEIRVLRTVLQWITSEKEDKKWFESRQRRALRSLIQSDMECLNSKSLVLNWCIPVLLRNHEIEHPLFSRLLDVLGEVFSDCVSEKCRLSTIPKLSLVCHVVLRKLLVVCLNTGTNSNRARVRSALCRQRAYVFAKKLVDKTKSLLSCGYYRDGSYQLEHPVAIFVQVVAGLGGKDVESASRMTFGLDGESVNGMNGDGAFFRFLHSLEPCEHINPVVHNRFVFHDNEWSTFCQDGLLRLRHFISASDWSRHEHPRFEKIKTCPEQVLASGNHPDQRRTDEWFALQSCEAYLSFLVVLCNSDMAGRIIAEQLFVEPYADRFMDRVRLIIQRMDAARDRKHDQADLGIRGADVRPLNAVVLDDNCWQVERLDTKLRRKQDLQQLMNHVRTILISVAKKAGGNQSAAIWNTRPVSLRNSVSGGWSRAIKAQPVTRQSGFDIVTSSMALISPAFLSPSRKSGSTLHTAELLPG